jgi:molecular chaperone DnaK
MYVVGIDIGTTFTAAAVSRHGRAEIVQLGSSATAIPSVVLLREDGEVLTGETAERRSVSEPSRVAREFKRRMGDPTPIVVGGTPYGAEGLVAHILKAVLGEVSAREGGPPDQVVLTHPASWGAFKIDLLRQAARQAELPSVQFLTEPEAAAIHYSTLERIEPGEIVAVYDLGGGTFDAAVLRLTSDGFDLLGVPEGMERFGGIDIDRAVLSHVDNALDGLLREHAEASDASVRTALARLRDDVRTAKEALSTDTDSTIPVMLPALATEVRLTRAELEAMIRPRLVETVDALDRCVRSAGLQWDAIARVLMVGGSSRLPIAREVLRERTGRPVVVDAHPKHAIALGAAQYAIARAARTSQPTSAATPPSPPTSPPLAAVGIPGSVAPARQPMPEAPAAVTGGRPRFDQQPSQSFGPAPTQPHRATQPWSDTQQWNGAPSAPLPSSNAPPPQQQHWNGAPPPQQWNGPPSLQHWNGAPPAQLGAAPVPATPKRPAAMWLGLGVAAAALIAILAFSLGGRASTTPRATPASPTIAPGPAADDPGGSGVNTTPESATAGPLVVLPATATSPATTPIPATVPAKATAPATTTVAATIPATAATTAAPAVPLLGGGTVQVTDATNSFVVSLPAQLQTSITPVTLRGTTWAHVSAASDLARYLGGDWTTIGVTVLVAHRLDAGTPSEVVAAWDAGVTCTSKVGPLTFAAAQGAGVVVHYDGCGGGAFAEVLAAIDVPSKDAVVFIGVQGPGPSDGVLQTFTESVLASVRQA